MLRSLLISFVVVAVAMILTDLLLPGFKIDGGAVGYLVVAFIFGLVNAIIGPIIRILTLPLTIMTFGLFALVVNGALLGITALITPYLELNRVISAIVAALVISILSAALAWFFRHDR